MGMTDKSMEKAMQRQQWRELLNAGYMFHQQMVKETQPEILGQKASDDNIFHKALAVAILDAINFIEQVESMGWFDEVSEEDLMSNPGPAG